MRPAYLRPEPWLMRRARQADYDLHHMRPTDLFAMCLGYGLMLAIGIAGLIALVDAIQGNPQTVLPQIAALLARLD